MQIEVLYVYGCPNLGPTLERLNAILAATRIDAAVELTAVDHHEAALTLRFLGSPTVRINGVDIEPSARSRTDFGIMCRTYQGSGGVPSDALIRTALAAAQRS